jgi:hypothetical protein
VFDGDLFEQDRLVVTQPGLQMQQKITFIYSTRHKFNFFPASQLAKQEIL